MAYMGRRQPGAVAKPVTYSANFPSAVYLPNSLLYPAEHGNPNRSFNDQELGELAVENKAILSFALSYNTWAVNTDVLTSVLWPKVKLREGVHRVEGKRFEYDIVPTTAVPPRGTVRFMSKKTSSFSLAIGQKGIGSKFEGRALRSEYGPNLLAMEIQAYAESISLGMSLNTAINAVNVAHRAPYLRQGSSYALNKAQEMGREIRLWCSLGLDPSRINVELGHIVTEKPDMNMMLVPEGFENYMQELILTSPPREEAILKQTRRGNQIIEVESDDRVMSITSMANGRVSVYTMPSFRYAKVTMQPLSTISRIGEVYPMYGELDAEGKRFSKATLDIYVYNEPGDNLVKLRFPEMMDNSRIWNEATEDYSDELQKYLKEINAEALSGVLDNYYRVHPQFPLSPAKLPRPDRENATYEGFVLPTFIGGLSAYHLSAADFVASVTSVVAQLSTGGANLVDAIDDITAIDNLRVQIEDEQYNEEYWAEVVRLNINRSVTYPNGNAIFTGAATQRARAQAHGSKIITEWAPNRYGALDIPNTGIPAGMWSAGGLLTIANTLGHPLKEQARRAYQFFAALATKAEDALSGSAVFNFEEMPVNMPKNDAVQLVMTACFGPRAPLFLAAPLEFASEGKSATEQVRRPAQRGAVPTSSVVYAPGILAPGNLPDYSSTGQGLKNAAGSVVIKTPSGFVLIIGNTNAIFDKDSPLYSPGLVGTELLARVEDTINTISDVTLRGKFIDVLSIQLADLNKGPLVVIRILSKLKSLNGDAAAILEFARAMTAGGNVKLERNIVIDNDIQRAVNDGVDDIKNRIAGARGSKSTPVSDRAARIAAALEKAVEMHRLTEPGYTPDKEFVVLEDNAVAQNALLVGGYQRFNLDRFLPLPLAAEMRDVREELNALLNAQAPIPLGAAAPSSGFDATSLRSKSVALARAQFYRTPLNMSYELLVTLARVEFPYILPGDPNDTFDTPADLSQDGVIDDKIYALPHYVQSKSVASRQVRSWTDVGMFSRVALGYGAYSVGQSVRSSAPIRSRGGVLEGAHRVAHEHAKQRPLPSALAELGYKDMIERIRMAVGEWGNNFVRRFAALAYLMTPLKSIEAMKIMIDHNIMPPFAILPWRLRSDHEVASFLVARGGTDSGANFYNGAHFDWAQDATRDVYQTRVVITTDAHAIRPENHRLIAAVMPRQYRGGHNEKIVTKLDDLRGHHPLRQASFISTVISRASLRGRLWPISFINHPPAQIERVGNDVDPVVDVEAQHFEGERFYGRGIYGPIYGDVQKLRFDRGVIAQELNYKADPRENHLAMLGFHVRYDYKMQHYARPVDGNGHRHDRRLNLPGARAYLNGETSLIPIARDIQSFLLT